MRAIFFEIITEVISAWIALRRGCFYEKYALRKS